jgi:peptidoglycan-associated lipoprotein
MKLTKFSNLMVVGLALTVGAVGCKKRPGTITDLPGGAKQQPPTADFNPIPNPNPGPGTGITPPPTADTGITTIPSTPSTTPTGGGEAGPGHPGWPENPDALKGATVYFGFDQATIRSGEHSKLSEVATYLKNNPTAAVRVEGNCDERGTEEYNRSLGERRALAAREALVSMGIEPNRVDTVSYGEDKPAVPGHDEAAFAKNRRDDFIVLTPPGAK